MFDMRQFVDKYADISDIKEWADTIMAFSPHFVIDNDYMHRWFILPRNDKQNVYLHHLLRSDEPIMHDHPWDSVSFIVRGGFTEHTPEGSFIRNPGDVVTRKAHEPHWLELSQGDTSVSLFFTGPKVREWGFHCPGGWVPWEKFTGGYHAGRSDRGAGCGEYG